jgi:hypothetical protein
VSIRQFLFCAILGPVLALFTIGAVASIPIVAPIFWLLGEKHPWREAWDAMTEPPIEMFKEGYRG